jgi:rhamnose utilization protein RhaD (predicted bifunctional aldolase and dehydrogenase)
MSLEFERLRAASARMGADPLLVQAAGGNTSIKQDGVMWIKASGTWLRDAMLREIFVPLDMHRLAAALAADDPACESCIEFVRDDINPLGLRPSIETSVHGLMPQAVVVHVHCVNTIALAIREDAEALLRPLFRNFNWAFVPYARPGLMLSRAIKSVLRPDVNVLVLGNHGLAVAGNTVAEAEHVLAEVVQALTVKPRAALNEVDFAKLKSVATQSGYHLPQDAVCHGIALDHEFWSVATSQVFYPDHVVFLGPEIPQNTSTGAAAVIVPSAGLLVHKSAKPSVEPMLRCLADVFARVPRDAKLKALTAAEIDQLLNWDAEKYRQGLQSA